MVGLRISAIDRKLLRDLLRLRGQILAVAMVIASGVAVLVMSLGTMESLDETAGAMLLASPKGSKSKGRWP